MVAYGLFLLVCAAIGIFGLWRAVTRYPIEERPYEPEDGHLPKYRTLREFFNDHDGGGDAHDQR